MMVADPGIFAQFLKAPKSVAEFGAEMDAADANKLELAAKRLQAQQATAAMADDQAARQATIAANGDQNALVRLLNQSGNYRAAQGIQKSMLDAQKTQADIGLSTAHAANYGAQTAKTQADVKYEAADRHARNLFGVSTIEDVANYIDEGVKAGVFQAEAAPQVLREAQKNGVAAWKSKALSGAVSTVDRFKEQAQMERAQLQADTSIKTTGMTNATSIKTTGMTNATSTANNRRTVDASYANAAAVRETANATRDAAKITKGMDNELKLRGDFHQEPVYKAHQEMTSAYAQIQQSLKQASPAGDLAGATKIMKLLDPGSVVRESELGMAMAASGLMDRVTNYAGNVINGTKLTPTQRKDFQALADALIVESDRQFNSKRAEYVPLAQGYGVNADRALGPETRTTKPAPPAAATPAAPASAAGWGIKKLP